MSPSIFHPRRTMAVSCPLMKLKKVLFGFGWYKFVTPFVPLKQYPFVVDIIIV